MQKERMELDNSATRLFAPGPGSPLLFLVAVTDLQVWVGHSPVSLVSPSSSLLLTPHPDGLRAAC